MIAEKGFKPGPHTSKDIVNIPIPDSNINRLPIEPYAPHIETVTTASNPRHKEISGWDIRGFPPKEGSQVVEIADVQLANGTPVGKEETSYRSGATVQEVQQIKDLRSAEGNLLTRKIVTYDKGTGRVTLVSVFRAIDAGTDKYTREKKVKLFPMKEMRALEDGSIEVTSDFKLVDDENEYGGISEYQRPKLIQILNSQGDLIEQRKVEFPHGTEKEPGESTKLVKVIQTEKYVGGEVYEEETTEVRGTRIDGVSSIDTTSIRHTKNPSRKESHAEMESFRGDVPVKKRSVTVEKYYADSKDADESKLYRETTTTQEYGTYGLTAETVNRKEKAGEQWQELPLKKRKITYDETHTRYRNTRQLTEETYESDQLVQEVDYQYTPEKIRVEVRGPKSIYDVDATTNVLTGKIVTDMKNNLKITYKKRGEEPITRSDPDKDWTIVKKEVANPLTSL